MNMTLNITDPIEHFNRTDNDTRYGNTDIRTNMATERLRNLNLNFALSLLESLHVVLVCSGILTNYLIMKTLMSLPPEILKSKFVILNALIADIMILVFATCSNVDSFLFAFGVREDYVHTCLDVACSNSASLGLYYRSLANLILACDRLYAILSPLTYYTVSYPKPLLICIIALNWLVSIALILPAFIIPFTRPLRVRGPGLCYMLWAGKLVWSNILSYAIVIGFGIVIFFVYIALFIMVRAIKSRSRSLRESRIPKMKSAVSLAVTYFIVHSMSLAMFLPGPIYGILSNLKLVKLTRSAEIIIRFVAIRLHMVNPIIDPIIIAFRIPAIKNKLAAIFDFKLTSGHHYKRKGTAELGIATLSTVS